MEEIHTALTNATMELRSAKFMLELDGFKPGTGYMGIQVNQALRAAEKALAVLDRQLEAAR